MSLTLAGSKRRKAPMQGILVSTQNLLQIRQWFSGERLKAAGRSITTAGLRHSEHISSALISLHWLRIPERIFFKLAVLTYRAIYGAGPGYFQSCFTRVADMPS